jgi:hypothetical protein
MQAIRLGNKVTRITVLQESPSGEVSGVVLYKRKRKKRKSTQGLTVIEKALEQMLRADVEFMDSYRRRFRRSSRRKRDGWLIDSVPNVFRAARDGFKKIRLERIV